jgi:hypothetical protein
MKLRMIKTTSNYSHAAKTALLSVVLSLFLVLPQPVQAQTTAWSGVCVYTEDTEVATLQGFQCLLANVFSIALTTIGIAGFIMLIIGSMKWLLSGGNAQHVEKAKNTMTYAIVGLIVALSAFIILNLVAEFTGVKTIMQFTIPDSTRKWGF